MAAVGTQIKHSDMKLSKYFTEHHYRLFPGMHCSLVLNTCDIYLLQQKSHYYRFFYKYLMITSHKLNLSNNSANDIK